MKILHICNWAAGITTRNVNALKQWSRYRHELVARIAHPYPIHYEAPTYTEATTTRETVLGMIEEADALHFHAVGYDGTAELPETVHGINFAQWLGKKRFIFTGMCSMLAPDGETWTIPCGEKFRVRNLDRYDLIMGPHLSCKHTYAERLEYAPDIIPIHDWLYTPSGVFPPARVCSFKGGEVKGALWQAGIEFYQYPTPTAMSLHLAQRRKLYRATLDNFTDGHWGLFGMESLAQGIPSLAYIHPVNMECFDILKAPIAPFLSVHFGGRKLAATLSGVLNWPEEAWREFSVHCREWMEAHYDPERLVWRWDDLYGRL